MSEHKYIWLQPECCADPDEGRHWCQDPDPVECDDGKLWTKYILASEHEALERQLEDVRQSLQRAEGERDKALKAIPDNWLDPLLTGPNAVIGRPPYNGKHIERLLDAIRKRIKPLPASDVDKPEGDTNA